MHQNLNSLELIIRQYEEDLEALKQALITYEWNWRNLGGQIKQTGYVCNDLITKEHQFIRTHCVMQFGAEFVRDFIANVYANNIHPQILENLESNKERRKSCSSASAAKPASVPLSERERRSDLARAERAKKRRTSPIRRKPGCLTPACRAVR